MKAKVMVVDDSEEVRDLIATLLKGGGYEPIPKASAAQLLASFGEAEPDAVLLDLQMPDGCCADLLPQIKKQWPDAEVIMLTGFAFLRYCRGGHQARRLSFPAQTV